MGVRGGERESERESKQIRIKTSKKGKKAVVGEVDLKSSKAGSSLVQLQHLVLSCSTFICDTHSHTVAEVTYIIAYLSAIIELNSSSSNHSSSFLSSVCLRPRLSPQGLNKGTCSPCRHPQYFSRFLIQLVIVLSRRWLSVLGLATAGTTQWHCE